MGRWCALRTENGFLNQSSLEDAQLNAGGSALQSIGGKLGKGPVGQGLTGGIGLGFTT
ncbi:MAG: hypothetical protein U1E36_05500 [Rickettsiales bacterium]